MPDSLSDAVTTRKCIKCKGVPKPLTDFPFKKGEVPGPNATHLQTCRRCDDKKRADREKKKGEKNKENFAPVDVLDSEAEHNAELSNLLLPEFLTIIGGQNDSLKLEANVDLSSLANLTDRKAKADALAQLVWEAMNIRFV